MQNETDGFVVVQAKKKKNFRTCMMRADSEP